MPKIIAYTYEADVHCVQCAQKRRKSNPFKPSKQMGEFGHDSDEHGFPIAGMDNESNLIRPVFSTDELTEEHCGDCHERIAP